MDPRTREIAAPAPPRGVGAWLFEHRRTVHVVCFALALAHPRPASLPWILAGAALLAAHVVLRCLAARVMGGAARVHARKAATRQRALVTSGPFRFVRNPIYVANSIGLAGAGLALAPPWVGLLAGLASLAWYRAVVAWEEQVLAGLYPADYPAYVARTSRFLPRFRRTGELSGDGAAPEVYPWPRVLRRERGAVLQAAVVVAVGLLKAALR